MNIKQEEEVSQMNKFLKGIHMGGATFKDYLNKAETPELKGELNHILESFKRHEEAITNKIDEMGGNAADSLGVMGTMAEFFEKLKLSQVNSDAEVCKHAEEAINMGIKQGKKFIDENSYLDKSLLKEAEGVVKDYDNHLRKIEEIELLLTK